jgi:hypothetical protein
VDQQKLGEQRLGGDRGVEAGDGGSDFGEPPSLTVLGREGRQQLLGGHRGSVGDAVVGAAEDFVEGVPGCSGQPDQIGDRRSLPTEFVEQLGARVDVAAAAMSLEVLARDLRSTPAWSRRLGWQFLHVLKASAASCYL